jgi:Transposase IS66 family
VEWFLPELFVFVAVPGVPVHNNLAERSMRPLVVARKISGGSRSPKGSATRMEPGFALWHLDSAAPQSVPPVLGVAFLFSFLGLSLNTVRKIQQLMNYRLGAYDYFPTWQSDLFLSLQVGSGKNRQRSFLDIWDGTKPFFISVRKARNYPKYAEEGDYWSTDQAEFPAILAVCKDTKTQKKLNRQIKHALNDSDADETIFATTTRQQLTTQSKPVERIWLRVEWDGVAEGATFASLFVSAKHLGIWLLSSKPWHAILSLSASCKVSCGTLYV